MFKVSLFLFLTAVLVLILGLPVGYFFRQVDVYLGIFAFGVHVLVSCLLGVASVVTGWGIAKERRIVLLWLIPTAFLSVGPLLVALFHLLDWLDWI